MKPSLQLKLGQSLTMTPQLQQAIRLLQLSTLDLHQEIQQALDSNPMLELVEDEDERRADESIDAYGEQTSAEADDSGDLDGAEFDSHGDDEWSEAIPEDLSIDTSWDEIYQSSGTGSSNPESDEDFESRNSVTESLQDHLRWQINLTHLSDVDRLIALNLIDGINPDGMLTTSIEDVQLSLARDQIEVDLDEIEAVLHLVQQLDPIGVGARTLAECLLLQLRQFPADTPWRKQAEKILTDHMAALGSRDYSQLMRLLKLTSEELGQVVQLIQQLNPRPGSIISSSQSEYIIPDVYTRKVRGEWVVELNPESMPRLRVNEHYAAMVRRADNGADNTFLRNNLQEARWFLKSLTSRNETLLKVARKIVEVQRGFLDHGAEAMKPLVLYDIAEAVGMHESTISRVTTQKFLHTPRGIFELKYFFSSHLETDSGGECSSTAIRAVIKKLISAESAKKPLSDSKITAILSQQGIKVARRTIAKYRESMGIAPSNERKQLP
ncbi:MAG: RNA polymerase factor sigma-54 [Pseudomonadales bacterium]|jgi:RNA polymerase sigma-54 factor|nr:RNA polymerase factor sigma-54 [Pseudomonadales bacterium]MCC6530687.1 RNA polymerase factor sigma-54 [Pseudomonadales bacterium]MCP5332883.1 RNA polymerase factor sigma-54 [Pseudomonadales bacterium]HMU89549.1 RNA polymerase factor sigma-54 [Pseudomonadales bacterium]HMW14695.1 RNA polymerase factor sigma-54 [Pseudomonadales bacterium]